MRLNVNELPWQERTNQILCKLFDSAYLLVLLGISPQFNHFIRSFNLKSFLKDIQGRLIEWNI